MQIELRSSTKSFFSFEMKKLLQNIHNIRKIHNYKKSKSNQAKSKLQFESDFIDSIHISSQDSQIADHTRVAAYNGR